MGEKTEASSIDSAPPPVEVGMTRKERGMRGWDAEALGSNTHRGLKSRHIQLIALGTFDGVCWEGSC